MKCNDRETIITWNQLDFYLANLKSLMQICDDFLHLFNSRPEDLEARERYLEALHMATSCVVNKAIELREEEATVSLDELKRQSLGFPKTSTEH